MTNKKYHTISEVSKALGVKEPALRSLDHLFNGRLTVIRGRRYYRDGDIETIKNALQSTNKLMSVVTGANSIDDLMNSMLALRARLISAL